jgi:hypothetical protein
MSQIKQRLMAAAIVTIGGATMLGAGAARGSHAAERAAAAATTSAVHAPSSTGASVSGDVERYANRERVTPALSNFRGGDTISGGSSSIALILALVLLLVSL